MANVLSSLIDKIFNKKTSKPVPKASQSAQSDLNFLNSFVKTKAGNNKEQSDLDFLKNFGKPKADISSIEGQTAYQQKLLSDNNIKVPSDKLQAVKDTKGLVYPGSDHAYDKTTKKATPVDKIGEKLMSNKVTGTALKVLGSMFNSIANPLTKASQDKTYSKNPLVAFKEVMGDAAKNSIAGIKAPWNGDESNMGSGHKIINNFLDSEHSLKRATGALAVENPVSNLLKTLTLHGSKAGDNDVKAIIAGDKKAIAKAQTDAGRAGFALDMLTPVPNAGIPNALKAVKAISKGERGLAIAKSVMGDIGRTKAIEELTKVGLVTEGNIAKVQKKVVKIRGGYDYKGITVGGVTVIKPETVVKLGETSPIKLLRKGLEAVKETSTAQGLSRDLSKAFKDGKNSKIMQLAKENPNDAYKYVATAIANNRANSILNKSKLNQVNAAKEIDKKLNSNDNNKDLVRRTFEMKPEEKMIPTTVHEITINPEYKKMVDKYKGRQADKYNKVDEQVKRLTNTIKDTKDNNILAKAKLDLHKFETQKEIMNSIDDFTSADYTKQLENAGIDSEIADKIKHSGDIYNQSIQEVESHLKKFVDNGAIKIPEDEIYDYAVRFKTAADKTLESVRKDKTLGKYADEFIGTSTIKKDEIKPDLNAPVNGSKPSDLFKAMKETQIKAAEKIEPNSTPVKNVSKELSKEEQIALDLKYKELDDLYKKAQEENAVQQRELTPKERKEAMIQDRKNRKVKPIPKALQNTGVKYKPKAELGFENYDMNVARELLNKLRGKTMIGEKITSKATKESDKELIKRLLKTDEIKTVVNEKDLKRADYIEKKLVNYDKQISEVKKGNQTPATMIHIQNIEKQKIRIQKELDSINEHLSDLRKQINKGTANKTEVAVNKAIKGFEKGLNVPNKDISNFTRAQKWDYLNSLKQMVNDTKIEGPEARTAHIKALRDNAKTENAITSNILGDKVISEAVNSDIRAPKNVIDKSGKVSQIKDNPSMGGKFDKNAEVDTKRIEGMESRVKLLEDAGVDISHLPEDTIKAIKERNYVSEQSFRELNKQITDTFEQDAVKKLIEENKLNKFNESVAKRNAAITPEELTKLEKMRGGVSGAGKEQIAYVRELMNRVKNAKTHGEYADLAQEIYKYKQAKKFYLEGDARSAQAIYDKLFGVKNKDMASTSPVGKPHIDGFTGYKWEGKNPEIKTIDFNIRGTVFKIENSSNSRLTKSILKAIRELPKEAREALGEIRILDGNLSIPEGAIPATANGKKITFFSNKATTKLENLQNIMHVAIHEAVHAGESTVKRDEIYKTFNDSMESLSLKQKNELYTLLKDSTSPTLNKVKLESVKGGQISTYPKLFSDVRRKQEAIAEIGAAFFGKNKPLANKLNELMPGIKPMFLDMLKSTSKDKLDDLVPKHIDGREDLIAQIDRTQNVIRAISDIIEPTENKIFSLKEQQDYLKHILTDDDFAVSEFAKTYGGDIEQFKTLDRIVLKKEYVYPEHVILNDEELEIYDFIKKQMGRWASEEQIQTVDRYMTHMMIPPKNKKIIKGINKDASLGDPKNIYAKMRRDGRAIDEINYEMAEKYPELYSATEGKKLPTYLETNLSRIYLQRALYHEKFMWEKTMAEDTLSVWGNKLHSLKQLTEMPSEELKELMNRKGISTKEPTGVILAGFPIEKDIPIEELHKKYTKTMYEDYFSSGNYVLLNTGDDFVESTRSTLADGALDKSIKQTNAKKTELFFRARINEGNEPLQQLIMENITNPFIEVSIKDISAGGIYEKNLENLHFMRKDMYHHYQDIMKSQARKETAVVLKVYDAISNFFKINATVVNPSFHVNNAVGNFMNSYLGIGKDILNPELHFNASKTASEKANGTYEPIAGMKKTYKEWREILVEEGVFGGEFFDKDTTKYLNRQSEQFGKKKNILTRIVESVNPVRVGKGVGKFLEDENKALNFFSHLKNGKTIEEAAELTNKFTFDYSDLTEFESSVMKRVFPFYTWLRKNTALQLEQLFTQPGKYAKMNQGVKDISQPETPEQYALRPDYLKNAIHLGEGQYRNLNLPMNDIQKMNVKDWFSSLNPTLKALIEIPTNTNVYYQSRIKQYKGEKVKAPTLLKLIAKDTPNGKMIDPITKYLYKSFMPAADNYGNLIETATGTASDEQRVKAQGFLEGSRKYVPDMKQLETSAKYNYLNQLKALYKQASKEGYIPQKQTQDEALQEFLNAHPVLKKYIK